MLFLNLAQAMFSSKPVIAQSQEAVGRYQITSWAAFGGGFTHHNGYYIVDTVTGKVVDKGAEVHDKGQ